MLFNKIKKSVLQGCWDEDALRVAVGLSWRYCRVCACTVGARNCLAGRGVVSWKRVVAVAGVHQSELPHPLPPSDATCCSSSADPKSQD